MLQHRGQQQILIMMEFTIWFAELDIPKIISINFEFTRENYGNLIYHFNIITVIRAMRVLKDLFDDDWKGKK